MTRQPRPSVSKKRTTKAGKPVRALKNQKDRTNSSRQWLLRQLNDPFVKKAQELGYRSRAAFKLLGIQEKYKILKKGYHVVDLGATPGGWSQVAVEAVKVGFPKGGKVVAVDINPMDPVPGVTFLQGDFLEDEVVEQVKGLLDGRVQVVLSDMAAPASGMTDVDHIRIMILVEAAFEFACAVLTPGGTFVSKVLQGGTEGELLKRLKKSFTKVNHFKPDASRKDSAEMFVVAQGFRGAA
jgi:23S rRNA (uridine2552-2'-O)-methyltransferase